MEWTHSILSKQRFVVQFCSRCLIAQISKSGRRGKQEASNSHHSLFTTTGQPHGEERNCFQDKDLRLAANDFAWRANRRVRCRSPSLEKTVPIEQDSGLEAVVPHGSAYMDGECIFTLTNPRNNMCWLFYYAISFVLSQPARTTTVIVLKLYNEIPLRDVIFPLVRFFFTESRRRLGFESTKA